MKLIAFPVFLLLFFKSFASDNYTWPEYVPKTIPDSLKNETAVFLENRTTIDFLQQFETSIIYFKRIQILSKKGVDDYSKFDLYQFNDGVIVLKKARIIKPDGQITEIDKEQIFESFSSEKLKYETRFSKRIQFVFPKLEVGDVIDIVYQIDYQEYNLSNTIFLEDELCSLNSRLSLRNLSEYELQIYTTRNMNDYVSNKEGDIPIFIWNKTAVPKRPGGFFSAAAPTASKVTYCLWYVDQSLDYATIFGNDYDSYHLTGISKSFNKYLLEKGVVTAGVSYFENLHSLISYMEGNFKWDSRKDVPVSVKLSDRFDEKQINYDLFFRYVQNFLEDNEIPYSVGYTKDLKGGVFEHGYVAISQLENRFLIISDALGNIHYLFPPEHENLFYFLDEIPYSCEGNQSILWEVHKKIEDAQFSKLILPLSDPLSNSHSCNILLKAGQTSSDSIEMKRRDIFSGHYSTFLRNTTYTGWYEELMNSEQVILPLEKSPVYPYQTTYKKEDKISGLISPIEDRLYWFDPASLLPKAVFFEGEHDEELPEYGMMPFVKTDKFSIYLELADSSSLKESQASFSKTNDIGSVGIEATQIGPNTIKFTYEIKLKKRILENRKENELFRELLLEWKNLKDKKWIIEMQ